MLAKVLNDQGVDMSGSTLRRYLKRSSAVGSAQRRQKPKLPPATAKKWQARQPATGVVPAPKKSKNFEAPGPVQRNSGFGVRSDTDGI